MVIQNGYCSSNSVSFLMGAGKFMPRSHQTFVYGTPVRFLRGNAVTYSAQVPGSHSTIIMFCRTSNRNNSLTYDDISGAGAYPNETPMMCISTDHTRGFQMLGGFQETKYLYIQFPNLRRNKWGYKTLHNSANQLSFATSVTEDLLNIRFK